MKLALLLVRCVGTPPGGGQRRGMVMKRLLLIAAIAVLGGGIYVADLPGAPAREVHTSGEMTLASAEAQSMVARLAEASMAMRRQEVPLAIAYAGPSPATLFGKK